MWGRSKGAGYKPPSTLPPLRQASRGGEPPRPPRNKRPQLREQQPKPQVESALPPLEPQVQRKKGQQRIGPKTFDEYWNDEWRKIEKDKINNAPQKHDFLVARRGREAVVDGEIAVLQEKQVAFMQGSNISYLPAVLTGGGLLCSDILRTLGRRTFAKDAGNGTGDVCYFRFVKDTRPKGHLNRGIAAQNINHFNSVGSSGGIFYVLRASDISGLSYRTASSTDSSGRGTSTIKQVVESGRWKTKGNNTEIGFSRAVDFARISEVYINRSIKGNVTLGNPLYNNAAALLEELEGKGISLPEKWESLSKIKKCACWWIDLLGFFMEMAGFQKIDSVSTSKGKFDVFERTGASDYVRGFRYDPEREEYPYPFPTEEEFLAGISAASEPAPLAEPSAVSKPASSAQPSATFGPITPKKPRPKAQAKIVKPSVRAGDRKKGLFR